MNFNPLLFRHWAVEWGLQKICYDSENYCREHGAPRAKPVVPCPTPRWGDISRLASGQAVLRWHIPPPG